MNNHAIAQKLLSYARGLTGPADLYRAKSYRHAAMVIDGMPRPVSDLLKLRGRPALAKLPGIGEHLAYTIDMLLRTGQVVPFPRRQHNRMVA